MPEVTFCQTETEFEISYSFNPGEDISLDIFGGRRIGAPNMRIEEGKEKNENKDQESGSVLPFHLQSGLVSHTGARRQQQAGIPPKSESPRSPDSAIFFYFPQKFRMRTRNPLHLHVFRDSTANDLQIMLNH